MDRVTCTLQLARRRHPAGPNSLDALCKRYGIDNTKRTKHGALVDSLLLAEVYIELLGVRQAAFIDFAADTNTPMGAELAPLQRGTAAQRPAPLPSRLSPELKRRMPPSSRRWAKLPSGAASSPPPTLRLRSCAQPSSGPSVPADQWPGSAWFRLHADTARPASARPRKRDGSHTC